MSAVQDLLTRLIHDRQELRGQVQSLQRQNQLLTEQNQVLHGEFEELFGLINRARSRLIAVFGLNETRKFLNEIDKVPQYSTVASSKAQMLSMIGRAGFSLLLHLYDLPIPSMSQIVSQRAIIGETTAFQKLGCEIVRHTVKHLTGAERLALLVWDETHCDDDIIEYFDREGRLLRGKKFLLVQLKSLVNDKFNQIIFADFDVPCDERLFQKIYDLAINYIGVDLVGQIGDNAPGNVKVWEKLGANHEKPYFFAHGHKIHQFSCCPHCIKLLRTHILEKLFSVMVKDENGNFKEAIVRVKNVMREFKKNPPKYLNLTSTHFNPTDKEKQNVKLALDLVNDKVNLAIFWIFL